MTDALSRLGADAAALGAPFLLGAALAVARPSGALWLPAARLLAVADLHLGKAARYARRGGALLPPYDAADTLARLAAEVAALDPAEVVCLGDSFDEQASAAELDAAQAGALAAMAAGRSWVWIAGNHDPAPHGHGGASRAEHAAAGLLFRHIAAPGAQAGEVSGHWHPKATLAPRGRRVTRRCFLTDGRRAILPAFGAYAGGLDAADPLFDGLLGPQAVALLTGPRVTRAPRAALVPRGAP
jgi:DNA ligase-associated metallophosphoesterase